MKLTAGYLRRSTTKQEASLEGQRHAIELWASANGYKIIRWYCDDGISGATGDARPEFLKMIRDAETLRDFQFVVCYDLSRFGRMENDEAGHYRFLLKKAGVQVVFSNEDVGGDGEMGEMIRPMLQSQKRQYLRQHSRDTLRGQLQSARAGFASGRAAAFGFDRILIDEHGQQRQRLKRGQSYTKSRSWHVTLAASDTPGEVETVRWLFETYRDTEIGLATLAQQLNEKGIPSPHGGDWGIATIREMLRNPVYKGQLCTGRRAEGDFYRARNGEVVRVELGEGKVVQRPQEEWIVRECPALVSADLWEAVQKKLALRGNRSRGARSRRLSYPLGSLICCGDCGGGMVGMKTDRSHQIYACNTHFRNKSCNYNAIRQEVLLNVLKSAIRKRLFCDGNMEAFKEALLSRVKQRPECRQRDGERIKKELREAKADLDKAAKNMLRADPENVPILNAAMTDLRNRVATLEKDFAAVQRTTDARVVVDEIVAKAERMLNDLFNAQGDRLKAVLSDLVDSVELRFTEGWKGKRRTRLVAAGHVVLKTDLTGEYRGDRI